MSNTPTLSAKTRSAARRGSVRRFVRHYLEMVAAMFAGMFVLGVPAVFALELAGSGWDELQADAPALALAGMAVVMTVPMVGWMRFRGHSWAPCVEMAASMLIPTAGVIALLATGVTTDFGALMGLEHVVMLPAMLVAMLLRRDEYAAPHTHHAEPATATA